MIIENSELRNKYHVFNSRVDAGERLGDLILDKEIDVLEIIPNGGIPVGFGLIKNMPSLPKVVDLLVVKKIHVPHSTEAGMGAITPDGDIYLNNALISNYSIDSQQIQNLVQQTLDRIQKMKLKLGISKGIDIRDKSVLIVDDGIASGFSMIAGAAWLSKKGAKEVFIGVPTAPISSLHVIEKKVDAIYCLNIREGFSFAVADAYKNWYDLNLEEASLYFNEIKVMIK